MAGMLDKKQIDIVCGVVLDLDTILVQLNRMAPLDSLSLIEKQKRFSFMEACLTLKLYSLGYEVTNGEGANLQNIGHMKGSLHYLKLAKDNNVFFEGKYQTSAKHYTAAGVWWESMGGAWGGRFNDANHFSISHGGKK
jgi:hypothetical protein